MKWILLLCTMLLSASGNAQSFFSQKKTKLKYIAQQIALCKLYLGYLKEGYDIAQKGWSFIDDIKRGDFDLHNNYFNSLMQVNPAIKGYSKTDGITLLQEQVLITTDAIKDHVAGNEFFSTEERHYIDKVCDKLLGACANDLDELSILTTNGSIELKDDERLERIDQLYANMQDKYSFIKSFEHDVRLLALSKARHSNDIKTTDSLYNLK